MEEPVRQLVRAIHDARPRFVMATGKLIPTASDNTYVVTRSVEAEEGEREQDRARTE